MTTETGSFATADGTRLALHWQGSSAEQAPLTLVLAHGWTLDSRSWAPVADRLTARLPQLRVLRYDHRGHGDSDAARPEESNIAQLADDLAELLRSEVSGAVVLAGHSMGGMTIMALAEQHPELVTQRVLGAAFVATSCGDLIPFDLGLKPVNARRVAAGERRLLGFTRAVERFRRRRRTARWPWLIRPGVRWLLFGSRPLRADVSLTARIMADTRPANLVDFRPTFDDHDRAEALPAFAGVPTLVLGGDRDRMTPFRHSEAIAKEAPGAKLVRYEDVGHMVQLERADEVAEELAELLGSVRVVVEDGPDDQEPGRSQRAG